MADRDWKAYNEALVRRGEIFLDLRIMKGWRRELTEMNEGKEGARFRYPDSFVRLLAFTHVYLRLPYRQLEGFVKMLSRYVDGLNAPDYSSMAWRTQRLDVKLNDALAKSNDEVVLALDASGIKVSNRGEWMRHKWKVKRGYLKIHIAVDVKSKRILALEVTKEKVADGCRLRSLVKEASEQVKVTKAIGDGAYDSKTNFRYLAGKKIEPVIKVRKNASSKVGGCVPRKLVAQEYLRNPKAWKRKHGYGQRWMVETVFSTFKRLFGEYTSSIRFRYMVKEMILKGRVEWRRLDDFNMGTSKLPFEVNCQVSSIPSKIPDGEISPVRFQATCVSITHSLPSAEVYYELRHDLHGLASS
jgi:hypothetical protein